MKKRDLFPMNEMDLKFSKIVIFSDQYKISEIRKCYSMVQISHFPTFLTFWDLENEVMVTNVQLVYISYLYIWVSLVEIHPFIQEIWCRQSTFGDLKNRVKVI